MSQDQPSADDRERERHADAVEKETDGMNTTETDIWQLLLDGYEINVSQPDVAGIIRIAKRIPTEGDDAPSAGDLSADQTGKGAFDRGDFVTAAPTSEPEVRQSDTPRTDEQPWTGFDHRILPDVARTLKRELAAVTAERDKLDADFTEAMNVSVEVTNKLEREIARLKDELAEEQKTNMEEYTEAGWNRIKEELRRSEHAESVYLATNERLLSDRDAARAALRKYGTHQATCDYGSGYGSYCTCGFTAALEACK